MTILITAVALTACSFVSFAFVEAGLDKLRTSEADLLKRGWGWVEKLPLGTAKFIGLSELLGGLGVILAPIAVSVFNFDWALPLGVTAGAGLVIVMILANLAHIVRKEFKYTYKSGLMLLAATAIATALLAVYPTA